MGAILSCRRLLPKSKFLSLKAVAVWSGAYNLVEDIFDCYSPIQDWLRCFKRSKLSEMREAVQAVSRADAS